MALAAICGVVMVVVGLLAIWSSPIETWEKLVSTTGFFGLLTWVLSTISMRMSRNEGEPDLYERMMELKEQDDAEARAQDEANDGDLDWRP